MSNIHLFPLAVARVVASGLLVGGLVGCSTKAEVKGQVTDGFGKPLPGASISVQNTTFGATTDSAGRYAVEYVPGRILVTIAKEGYTSQSLALDIATKAQYPAQPVTLYKVPTGKGIFAFGAAEYMPLPKGQVSSETPRVSPIDPPAATTYRVTGTFPVIPGGTELTFLDTDGSAPLIYEVKQNGLILIHRESWGRVVAHDASTFPTRAVQIAPGIIVRKAVLPDGWYAFSNPGDWSNAPVAYLLHVRSGVPPPDAPSEGRSTQIEAFFPAFKQALASKNTHTVAQFAQFPLQFATLTIAEPEFHSQFPLNDDQIRVIIDTQAPTRDQDGSYGIHTPQFGIEFQRNRDGYWKWTSVYFGEEGD